jgi:Ni,Fe-hydrogenase III large subunit/Ni,Fe-hydrogenase III component G
LVRSMHALTDILPYAEPVAHHRPWPRFVVTEDIWRRVAGEIAAGRLTLLGLWGDGDTTGGTAPVVHMAIMAAAAREIAVLSVACSNRTFPSVGALHPAAIRLERAIHSLYGYEPVGAMDTRPWLDLGFWEVQHPLGERSAASSARPSYEFLRAEGDHLHQIPVGPVHAGIIEPGHFRFTASGETVVRLEQRLGYVHKGIESLMMGAPIERAAELAARTSGDSTVAYSLAFAHAVEAATETDVPSRARYLRALMAELERLANHFGDIGAICNDASFSLMHAHCSILREHVLRAADASFGHRLMMDRVVPGGVASDLQANAARRIIDLLQQIRSRFPRLIELYDNTASLLDRTVSTGIVRAALAERFGASGFIGRASGRNVDARKIPGYAPYDQLDFIVPVLTAGDVNARVWVRIHEVEQSLKLIEEILERLPEGAIAVPTNNGAGEGFGLAESFRGDVMAWVRVADRRIARCHLRDPSWFQWPLLEAAIEGNIVADFPICNKSFNCSYAGHDL